MEVTNLKDRLLKQLAFDKDLIMEGEEILPYFLCYTKNSDDPFVIFTPFNKGDDKDYLLAMLAAYFYIKDVICYIFVSESWMRMLPKEIAENLDISELTPPSLVDDRQEVLMGCGISFDEKISIIYPIKRKGSDVTFLEPQKMDGVTIGGRFSTLLDNQPKEPIPDEIKTAIEEIFDGFLKK